MKGAELNSFYAFQIFDTGIIAQIFTIFFLLFLNSNFTMKGIILTFFTRQGSIVYHAKFCLLLSPLLPFINIFQNLDKVILLRHFSFFLCAKSGLCLYQLRRFLVVRVKMKRNGSLVSTFYAPKP